MDSDPPAGEVPYGTLDLMVLKTLQVMGALHGFPCAPTRNLSTAALANPHGGPLACG